MLCANTAALRSHFRTVSEEERRLTAIEDLAASLMLTEFANSRTDMVLEAMQEVSEPVADAIAIHMGHLGHKRCALEKARHYEMIGRLIAGMIDGYCARLADKQAREQIGYVCPF
jgi:hypothetical protein